MQSHGPGYNALRRGRYSASGREYFLTLTLKRPASGLEEPVARQAIRTECSRLEGEKIWSVRVATIMPDHCHFVVTLGESESLSSAVRLLKGRLTPTLRGKGLSWQSGFYDHLLRPEDDRLPVFLYVFLNPYRAGLVEVGRMWPGTWCHPNDWEWFHKLTEDDSPFPDWLK